MNCTAAHDLLPEHTLGVVGGKEAIALDRHLQWCAACRKEARDLERAASVLPWTLAPAEPDPDLEERIVEAIRAARGRTAPEPAVGARRGRLATVAVLAAMMALTGLGWGAVMAGRAARIEDSANEVAAQRQGDLRNFAELVQAFESTDADPYLGLLMPIDGGPERVSGTALTFVVPRDDDVVSVMLNGLPSNERRLPYLVTVSDGRGDTIEVGAIQVLDTSGGGELSARLGDTLRGYDVVSVRDARGRLVLRGTLEALEPVPSPSP